MDHPDQCPAFPGAMSRRLTATGRAGTLPYSLGVAHLQWRGDRLAARFYVFVGRKHGGNLVRRRGVALVGKLAGMTRREALQLLVAGAVAESPAAADLVVVGEDELPLVELGTLLDEQGRQAVENGTTRLMTETQLWQQLGLVEHEQHVHRLYTPAMLADLLKVPVAVVRAGIAGA